MGSLTDGTGHLGDSGPGDGGAQPPPTIVGICGGSGSGKTTLASGLVDILGPGTSIQLSFDAYYRDLSHLRLDQRQSMNFDHPDSLDADLLVDHLRSLRSGHDIAVPVYDFASYTRTGDLDLIGPRRYIVVEGILLFAFPEIRRELDYLVFRHCDEATRADRRLRRDVIERGRTPESVQHQWRTTVEPMYRLHVEPYARHADLVTSGDQEVDQAVAQLAAALATDSAHPAATG